MEKTPLLRHPANGKKWQKQCCLLYISLSFLYVMQVSKQLAWRVETNQEGINGVVHNYTRD